ncbi:DNA adenine methylase [Cupriavidus gilardii]|uniref:DNA adenine methylase n=1 Tax=Cupriavidus gilardii TaxID=82541 RepID=UPI0021C114E4|nr:DNA adenine methylase [Cupriavidus gilardii]MCT9117861.1 DNA adenine methylase [Cupriavidus gilardii]
MKYMGHKGKLLPVLGEILIEEAGGAKRIADPFCGSGAVSWFLAQNTDKVLIAGDLQAFAVARASAIVERTEAVDSARLLAEWFAEARSVVNAVTEHFPNAARSVGPDYATSEDIRYIVARSRTFCSTVLPPLLDQLGGSFPMAKAYGGHYFSPLQAIQLDALRLTLPEKDSFRKVALAGLIEAASKCAAAPGHTAQPFQPTVSAAQYIIEAWNRNVWDLVSQSIDAIASSHARVAGEARARDFVHSIETLEEGDLVFADPPYSDVHYSRFYHVLETLTKGQEITVFGKGRYPPLQERPASSFSRRGQSLLAAKSLVESCAQKKVNLVLTFPSSGASNGLSADHFVDIGRRHFAKIEKYEVASNFSTLGGGRGTRGGRKACTENIVCFKN